MCIRAGGVDLVGAGGGVVGAGGGVVCDCAGGVGHQSIVGYNGGGMLRQDDCCRRAPRVAGPGIVVRLVGGIGPHGGLNCNSSKHSPVPIDDNAPMTTTIDTLSISTPSVNSAKNVLVSSETDRDTQFFVDSEDNDDDDAPHSPTNSPVPTDNAPMTTNTDLHPDSAYDGGIKADDCTDNSWTKVPSRYPRCQEPSYAATIANAKTATTPMPP